MRASLLLLLSLFLFSFANTGSTGIPPNESRTIGRKLPDIELIDYTGKVLRLNELSGKPVILNPIYTHCTSACPLMTKELKKILPLIGKVGRDFYVISLTFDPQDGVEDLKRFAQREGISMPGWFVVKVKNGSELFKLLDAIDFRFATLPDRNFVHPNILVFLSKDLKIVKYIYGVNYDPLDMRLALGMARGETSLLAVLRPYFFFIGLAGLSLTSVFLVVLLSKKKRVQAKAGI